MSNIYIINFEKMCYKRWVKYTIPPAPPTPITHPTRISIEHVCMYSYSHLLKSNLSYLYTMTWTTSVMYEQLQVIQPKHFSFLRLLFDAFFQLFAQDHVVYILCVYKIFLKAQFVSIGMPVVSSKICSPTYTQVEVTWNCSRSESVSVVLENLEV